MTATYDPAEVERLVREAREFLAILARPLTDTSSATYAAERLGPVNNAIDRYAAMADQLEAARDLIAGLSPAAIQALVDENDRLMRAFDEALKKLHAGASVQAGFCCWCGQHWPHLDGETYEALRKYTADHAETCPAHSIRIERDAAQARIAELEASVERMAPVVAAAERYRDDGACYAGIVPAVDAYRAKARGTG